MRRPGDTETRGPGDTEKIARGVDFASSFGRLEALLHRVADIRSFRELRVYRAAKDAAMTVFHWTKEFPPEEERSMVSQMRRSSRSVCANIAEAWRRRRYPRHFGSKLGDAESEAEETRVWLEFALGCRYLDEARFQSLDVVYDRILAQLVCMIVRPGDWTIRSPV